MERLTERNPYWLGEEFWTSAKEPDEEEVDKVYERLKYYEDLEEQGLLLRLPCKVQANVFKIKIYYTFDLTDSERHMEINQKLFELNDLNDFGKTVFLTREEAEMALAKMEVR